MAKEKWPPASYNFKRWSAEIEIIKSLSPRGKRLYKLLWQAVEEATKPTLSMKRLEPSARERAEALAKAMNPLDRELVIYQRDTLPPHNIRGADTFFHVVLDNARLASKNKPKKPKETRIYL